MNVISVSNVSIVLNGLGFMFCCIAFQFHIDPLYMVSNPITPLVKHLYSIFPFMLKDLFCLGILQDDVYATL